MESLQSALADAVNKGNLKEVQNLIQAKADIHAEVEEEVDGMFPDYDYDDGLRPIHVAAQLGHTNIVETLVKAGAKVDLEGDIGQGPGPRGRRCIQAIHLAAGNGKTETVEALVKLKADVSASAGVYIDGYPGEHTEYPDYDCPIHFAADYGHAETVEALVRLNADVDSAASYEIERYNGSVNGWEVLQEMQPIHVAAWRGHEEVVRTLIRLGASVEAEGSQEQTGDERHVSKLLLLLLFLLFSHQCAPLRELARPLCMCIVPFSRSFAST